MPSHNGKPVVIDPAWRRALRDQRCVFTGRVSTETESVVGAHIGTHGRGIKTDDNMLPMLDSIHQEMHQRGEITVIRERAPNWLLREMARAYAQKLYWQERGKAEHWAKVLVGDVT